MDQLGDRCARGYIGKTMGVMPGGPFDGKIEDVALVAGSELRAVAEKVRQGLKRNRAENGACGWRMSWSCRSTIRC